jgi:hypothetical protein
MRQYCPHTPTICDIIDPQCSLSDSVLAWRCFVIFGKRRWLKWTLPTMILAVTGEYHIYLWGLANFCTIVSGIFPAIIDMIYYWETFVDNQPAPALYHLVSSIQFPTSLTWAVCSLVLNTVLSTSIAAKIM